MAGIVFKLPERELPVREVTLVDTLYNLFVCWETLAFEVWGTWYTIGAEQILEFATQNYLFWPVQDFWFGYNYRCGEVTNFFWR